jgi:hypothetical protein
MVILSCMEYAFKPICCNNIFVMVFESKTHAKNDRTLLIFGGFYPPLQIFDSSGVLYKTK